MKRGFHTLGALDRLVHPLDWNGIRDLVRSLHWDGDVQTAFDVAEMMAEHFRLNFRHHRYGSLDAERASERFYLWLGISEVLGAVVAIQSSRRRQLAANREDVKLRRELGLGPRRPARRARSSSSPQPGKAKAGAS